MQAPPNTIAKSNKSKVEVIGPTSGGTDDASNVNLLQPHAGTGSSGALEDNKDGNFGKDDFDTKNNTDNNFAAVEQMLKKTDTN